MGFYHYLTVSTNQGEKIDIGGYSKGGSKPYWFFAFSPLDYYNNLEEFVANPNGNVQMEVGYTTTVFKAKERVRYYYERLFELSNKSFSPSDEKFYYTLINGFENLLHQLSSFDDMDTLNLNQNDGACYLLEDSFTKLDSHWYQNIASENEAKVKRLESSNISIEKMIEEFANDFSQEERGDFFDELRCVVAHEERGYGPNPISEYLLSLSYCETLDVPSSIYKLSMKYIIKNLNEDKTYDDYPEEVKTGEIVSCHKIISSYIDQTLSYLKTS